MNTYIKNKPKEDGCFLKLIEALLYIAIVHLSYLITLKLALFAPYDNRNLNAYHDNIWLILSATILILFINGALSTANKTSIENVITMLMCSTMIAIVAMAIAFVSRKFAFPRTLVLHAFIIQSVSFIIIKFIIIYIVNKRRGYKNIMIIAELEHFESITEKLLSNNPNKDHIIYCVRPNDNLYLDYINKVDRIVISEDVPEDIKNDVFRKCIALGKSVYIIPRSFEIVINNSRLLPLADDIAFNVKSLNLSLEKRFIKRITDLVLSSLGIVISSPLMLIIALILLIVDGKPVLFLQERATIDNKIFKLIKFRSMVNDAEKETGAVWSPKNDSRITKTGGFLRKYWLDELPQLINVLKGDMSFVGPRPERPIFIAQFATEIPEFEYRMSVKAGVTGYAQLLGKHTTSPESKIKFDLMYIVNAGFFTDMNIIIETIKKILVGTLSRGEEENQSFDTILTEHCMHVSKENSIITITYGGKK